MHPRVYPVAGILVIGASGFVIDSWADLLTLSLVIGGTFMIWYGGFLALADMKCKE